MREIGAPLANPGEVDELDGPESDRVTTDLHRRVRAIVNGIVLVPLDPPLAIDQVEVSRLEVHAIGPSRRPGERMAAVDGHGPEDAALSERRPQLLPEALREGKCSSTITAKARCTEFASIGASSNKVRWTSPK